MYVVSHVYTLNEDAHYFELKLLTLGKLICATLNKMVSLTHRAI